MYWKMLSTRAWRNQRPRREVLILRLLAPASPARRAFRMTLPGVRVCDEQTSCSVSFLRWYGRLGTSCKDGNSHGGLQRCLCHVSCGKLGGARGNKEDIVGLHGNILGLSGKNFLQRHRQLG
jgi:hypothetical protein